MMKRILHPSDFSSASRRALREAVKMAKSTGASLELLHAMTPFVPVGGIGASPKLYDELAGSTKAWAHKEMEKLLKVARAAGVKTTSTIVKGTAAEQIVRMARVRRADLIVMGTHGRTGFSRLLLGSVAARVIAASPCPVLTVRGTQDGTPPRDADQAASRLHPTSTTLTPTDARQRQKTS